MKKTVAFVALILVGCGAPDTLLQSEKLPEPPPSFDCLDYRAEVVRIINSSDIVDPDAALAEYDTEMRVQDVRGLCGKDVSEPILVAIYGDDRSYGITTYYDDEIHTYLDGVTSTNSADLVAAIVLTHAGQYGERIEWGLLADLLNERRDAINGTVDESNRAKIEVINIWSGLHNRHRREDYTRNVFALADALQFSQVNNGIPILFDQYGERMK